MPRKLTDILEAEKKKGTKVKDLLDKGNFIMFFTKDNNIFGAPEESRLIFSKMKSPDEDEDWNRAQFSGLDLLRALTGAAQEVMFSHKDLPSIQVIDRDEAENRLSRLSATDAVSCAKQGKPIGVTATGCGCGDGPRI